MFWFFIFHYLFSKFSLLLTIIAASSENEVFLFVFNFFSSIIPSIAVLTQFIFSLYKFEDYFLIWTFFFLSKYCLNSNPKTFKINVNTIPDIIFKVF
jgi:hypothetical protein